MKSVPAALFFMLCLSTTQGLAKGIAFELNAVPLSQALHLWYVHVFDKPFMLSPELAEDKRVVTFRITPDSDERVFMLRYLKNMNIAVHIRHGIDYLASFTPKIPVIPQDFFVYRPRLRSVGYLTEMLASQFSGKFNARNAQLPSVNHAESTAMAGTASDFINRSGDVWLRCYKLI